ncbi:hypothetical protein H257_12270 [Aphanomyces astaci]|uniref:Uncharacterized protein n=1 Tax=Aphanomyces astaci TaxID=112090 RepID=W4G1K4_APHAT|nr:hypothetical protein H257_12270 [Aphanomyces astaci]ETV72939.1 hypothetical protein H257_12270 [Aphanomyces astaci]|eukprot:XP_009837725.1 hypothetical protein H257_12270 [Aphanomyces astaci]
MSRNPPSSIPVPTTVFPAINFVAAVAAYHQQSTTDPNFISPLEPNAPLPPLHSIVTIRPCALLHDKPLA